MHTQIHIHTHNSKKNLKKHKNSKHPVLFESRLREGKPDEQLVAHLPWVLVTFGSHDNCDQSNLKKRKVVGIYWSRALEFMMEG